MHYPLRPGESVGFPGTEVLTVEGHHVGLGTDPRLSGKAAMLLTTGSTLKILHPSYFNAGSKDQTWVEKFLFSVLHSQN